MTIQVVGIGELLWDLLPDGPRLGGAPCNVIVNLVRLGHAASYITAVGDDELGRAALLQLAAVGVDASFIVTLAGHATGTARVELDDDGVPGFTIARPAAYDAIELSPADVDSIVRSHPRALVFGTLAQQAAAVRHSTLRLAAACADAIRLYDVNLREGGWDEALVRELAELASVIKLNEQEARTIGSLFGVPASDTEALCAGLATRLGLRGVAITAGKSGASLLLDGIFARAAAPDVHVVDTIGSGDAFSAALIDGIARGASAEAAVRRANALGGLIAARPGATPRWTLAELGALEARMAVADTQPGISRDPSR
jgi:fructokinase